MKLMIVCIIASTFLSGCASLGQKYCKAGSSSADFERDKYECEIKTRSGNPSMMLIDLEYLQKCIAIEKGWHRCSAEELGTQ